MKTFAYLALPLLAVTGCNATAPTTKMIPLTSGIYDVTKVCLTDPGNPVS